MATLAAIRSNLPITKTDAGKTPPNYKPTVSIPDINKRTATAAQIEKIFSGIQPGQKLANANEYLDKLRVIGQKAVQDYAKLYRPNIKVTEPIQKAREALNNHVAGLRRVTALAQSANIIPTPKLPWEGQLQEGETPLHWAVRNHDHKMALTLRYEIRQSRLEALCRHYAKTVKNSGIAAIFKKQGILPKLLYAIELLHVLSFKNLNSKELQQLLKDPDIIKVVQDPDFRKILVDPQTNLVLNSQDVLGERNSKGISPLEEAILQNDHDMAFRLLFPHLIANQQLKEIFWSHIKDLKSRIADMRQVDLNSLSAEGSLAAYLCQAAYLGDLDALMTETEVDFKNIKDKKGLTPLHYALLGGQVEAVQYLLQGGRSNLYTLTSQGHSYYDYAILSGHSGLANLFQQRFKLPFKLGNEQEKFSYLLASGVFDQQLNTQARSKDLLAFGGMDTIFGAINATWAGAHLLNHALHKWVGTPTPGGVADWMSWSGANLEHCASGASSFFSLSRIFNILPPKVASVASTCLFANGLVIPMAIGATNMLGLTAYNWPGAIKLLSEQLLHIDPSYLTIGYAALRIGSAVTPVLTKLPAYRDNFTSRPMTVLKNLAIGAADIGITVLLATNWSQPGPQPSEG